MKIADVLRKLADTIDHHGDNPSQPDEKIINPGRMVAVVDDSEHEACDACGEDPCGCESSGEDQQPDDVYVPPLQLKLELLKKAAGVESIYDGDENEHGEQGAVETYGQASNTDEVSHMRKLATLMNASDDEPLDD